ncbi:helix-turn-helix transcriptional regulator [Actinoplanes sp. GCM10030250]|uniref:helix-turn-helix transcriptional regulator n=1 Tax=Actinoplanes sp. GCM10030250 TaxID=3273376 RepID=UPI0036070A9B
MNGDPLRLVGAHEIREMLGVSRQRAYQLAGRPDFPKPIAKLAQGKIWDLDDIEAWISTNRTGKRRRDRQARPPSEGGTGQTSGPEPRSEAAGTSVIQQRPTST